MSNHSGDFAAAAASNESQGGIADFVETIFAAISAGWNQLMNNPGSIAQGIVNTIFETINRFLGTDLQPVNWAEEPNMDHE